MYKILHIILISLFSLTVISCAKEEEKAPVIAEVYPVTTPTDDHSPNYTFSSTKAGTITYGGSCSSGTTSATSGNNTITFLTLSDGTYSDCTIIVTDSDGNASNTLSVTTFIVDTTALTVSSIYPTDNQSGVSITDNISVTFSETMDTTYVTTNSSDTYCSGTLRVSSDNFSTCVKMSSSPASSNSDKTFTLDPSDNLSYSTTYKIIVTTGVKDSAGNTLSSQYETSSGFTTVSSSGGKFVAVGASGTIITSSDNGTSWNSMTSGISKLLNEVTYGNSIFVTVGYGGTILTSSVNGTTWNDRSKTKRLWGATYANSTFTVVGNS